MGKSVQKLLFSLLIVILNLALLVQANSVELEDKPLFSITSDSNSLEGLKLKLSAWAFWPTGEPDVKHIIPVHQN